MRAIGIQALDVVEIRLNDFLATRSPFAFRGLFVQDPPTVGRSIAFCYGVIA